MIQKKQNKLIACLVVSSLMYATCILAPSARRSALFSSLDVEEAEISGPEPMIVDQPDRPAINPEPAASRSAAEPEDENTAYKLEDTTQHQQFFEDLDMPQEFLPVDENASAHELEKGQHEDGSPLSEDMQEDLPDMIEFNFEDADILNLLTEISTIFDVTFITDEILNPLGPGGKALKGNKISFKTHAPLTRQAAWNLFLVFLDLAGFALVPEPDPQIYRVATSDKAQQAPVPTFIGVPAESLPDNDQMVRFVYFIENADINTLKDIVNTLKSPSARAILLQEIKALVITDRSYNIKSLMKIVGELDQVSMPQSMSVLKLRTADVTDVEKLYRAVSAGGEGQENQPRTFGARKQSASLYFPENARMIAEPRTNSLILLGPADAIKKIEDFIVKYVDVDLEKPYSPLYTHILRYASAVTVSEIMNNMSQFGADTAAGKTGGVRGGDKYVKPISFTALPATNTIIIKGDYEDYMTALEIIKKLDEPQPQVAIEALILTMDFEDNRQVGSQIRNKVPGPNGLLGNNVDFQTSGIALGGTPQGIQTNNNGPGVDRLLANLINLVTNATAGNTVVSLGFDAFGVWGIFNILQSITNVQVVSNPFLVATNKTQASVAVGQIRRLQTSNVVAGENQVAAFGDWEAKLKLEVTPQVNSDGMIVLKLNVLYENFISSITSTTVGAKNTRLVDTRTIVADKEVIAIGGLVENTITETLTKVPILGDIPILGWLFRNKGKDVVKSNLLILISTRIIEPEVTESIDPHTQGKLEEYYDTHESFYDTGEYRDPVYRRFFADQPSDPTDVVEDFFFNVTPRAEDESSQELSTPKTKVTRNGKFYRPGGKKDAAVILPPPEPERTQEPADMNAYPRSPLMKHMMNGPDKENIRITQKTTPARRRDARRSISSDEKPIGVLT